MISKVVVSDLKQHKIDMFKSYSSLVKKMNSKIFYKLCVCFLFLLFFACSAIPQSWSKTCEIKSVNVDVASQALEIDLSGYPPYTLEIYDNFLFEGDAVATLSGDFNEGYNFDVATTSMELGSPYYLRVKSHYGEWLSYADSSNNPVVLIVTDSAAKGEDTNPYIIETQADLIGISENDPKYGTSPWLASYVLVSDIDLTGIYWKPIGCSVGGKAYKGLFNGNGYVVSGLNHIDTSNGGSSAGFFGDINNGTIKNLGLKIGNLELSGIDYMGGLVGLFEGTISGCYVIGDNITGGDLSCGGLVGYVDGSVYVTDCYTDIEVEGPGVIGGVLGFVQDITTFERCYAVGDVLYTGSTSGQSVGGLIGYLDIDFIIKSCLALNNKVNNASGSAGDLRYIGKIRNGTGSDCYYNSKMNSLGGTALISTAVYGIPINPYTMNENADPFNSWDFIGTWKWDDATNRPVLRKVHQ